MTREEFEEFFLLVYPQLVRYVRTAHDPSAAEDLASKTLEDLWEMDEPAPTDEQSFYRLRKFTFAILHRHVGHHLRDESARRRRENVFSTEQALQGEVPDIAEEIVDAEWPEWASDLREEERYLLELHAHKWKPAEIAPILGIKPTAVSARLQRVKDKARGLWGKEANRDETE
ncbi:sigma-70 family RNA polymerase sigma factor [Nocardioides sp.]|uniref:sigma-70 family RNA polymerase sigma factor n=1 Tax=Nocardioides sp. TaxID=35761 RepID=UPI0039E2B233